MAGFYSNKECRARAAERAAREAVRPLLDTVVREERLVLSDAHDEWLRHVDAGRIEVR